MTPYRQKVGRGFEVRKWEPTEGYPCPLPLFPTQFAVVRPPRFGTSQSGPAEKGWQVIHIRTGKKVAWGWGCSTTIALAKDSAMAELERVFKKYGKRKVMAKVGE